MVANPIYPGTYNTILVVIMAMSVPGTAYNVMEPKLLKNDVFSMFTAPSNIIGGSRIIMNIYENPSFKSNRSSYYART
jgi:hypothetical protein